MYLCALDVKLLYLFIYTNGKHTGGTQQKYSLITIKVNAKYINN